MTVPISRVLLIDDEPVIHELVREVLHDAEVTTFDRGEPALEHVRAGERFDVALVDKNLPDRSGLEIIRALRALRPELEVLVITGYPSFDSAREALELGAFDYLIKPFRDVNDLRLRVGNAVEHGRQRQASADLLEALRGSERRYRELFEASPDAIMLLDAASRTIRDVNAATETIYARPRAELVGQRADALFSHAGTPPLHRGQLIERRGLRADGTCFPVEVRVGYLEGAGEPLVLEVIRDVSERERAAAERLALEEQVRRAQKLDALGRLAAGVAHDFANLLQVIGSCAGFLTDEIAAGPLAEDPGVRSDLQQIERACQSGADLTRRLLGFVGRRTVQSSILDLGEVVGGTVAMLARTLGDHVTCDFDAGAGPRWVLAGRGQLEQIVTNLVVNARDAMPDGGRITIAIAGNDAEPEAVLTISDTGGGIPPELLESIFEPFFSTKPADRGTGLGLATVQQIVTQLGGRIDVRSTVGQGTTFALTLPRSGPPGAAPSVLMTLAGRGERVLLVEDDPAVRAATARILVGGGFAVEQLADAESALARVDAGARADVLLIDLGLPRMQGLACANALVDRLPDLRVIFMSAFAPDPRGNGRTPAGANFLAKPYERSALLRCVRETLDAGAEGKR